MGNSKKMGTLAEKIISRKAKKKVQAGEIVIVPVDWAFCQDGTGPLTIDGILEIGKGVKKSENCIFFIDHAVPPPRKELANAHKKIRDFAEKFSIKVFMQGVCHQLMVEKFSSPYDIIAGADSHTPTSGALGAFASGFGSTDVASAFVTGSIWLKVPEVIAFKLKGKLNARVSGKDLILKIVGDIGSDGAIYKSLEFFGEGVKNISMDDRFTISNMSIEAGAKTGIFPADEITEKYLKEMGRENDFEELLPDESAYKNFAGIDLSEIKPQVAFPHEVSNVYEVEKIEKTPIDVVFIGTCTNGRFSDFLKAGEILKKSERIKTRLIIGPASKDILHKLISTKLIDVFLRRGAILIPPGCGPCCGVHEGILADGERCLSTANRNFKGRMGNPESFVYLASPETCAATAITGFITDPRKI